MIGFILYWIIIGLIAGVLARLIMPGRDPIGWVWTIVLGIVGALLGGVILDTLQIGSPTFGWRVLEGVIGAFILLAIYHFFERRRV